MILHTRHPRYSNVFDKRANMEMRAGFGVKRRPTLRVREGVRAWRHLGSTADARAREKRVLNPLSSSHGIPNKQQTPRDKRHPVSTCGHEWITSENKLQDTTRRRDTTHTARWASHVRVIRQTFVSRFRGKNDRRPFDRRLWCRTTPHSACTRR